GSRHPDADESEGAGRGGKSVDRGDCQEQRSVADVLAEAPSQPSRLEPSRVEEGGDVGGSPWGQLTRGQAESGWTHGASRPAAARAAAPASTRSSTKGATAVLSMRPRSRPAGRPGPAAKKTACRRLVPVLITWAALFA